jgi:hypothetical protein
MQVATRDGQLVLRHDLTLDDSTSVRTAGVDMPGPDTRCGLCLERTWLWAMWLCVCSCHAICECNCSASGTATVRVLQYPQLQFAVHVDLTCPDRTAVAAIWAGPGRRGAGR